MTNIASIDNRLKGLAKLAIEQGWDIEVAPGGHLKWHGPKEFVTTSASLSDQAIVRTIQRDLERAGLITDRRKWKEIKRYNRKIQKRFEEWYTPAKLRRIAKQMLTMHAPGSEAEGEALSVLMLNEDEMESFGLALAKWDVDNSIDGPPNATFDSEAYGRVCVKCKKECLSGMAMLLHTTQCDEIGPLALALGEDVEDILDAPPPGAPVCDILEGPFDQGELCGAWFHYHDDYVRHLWEAHGVIWAPPEPEPEPEPEPCLHDWLPTQGVQDDLPTGLHCAHCPMTAKVSFDAPREDR